MNVVAARVRGRRRPALDSGLAAATKSSAKRQEKIVVVGDNFAASPRRGDTPATSKHYAVQVRGTSLTVLTCLGMVVFFQWARPVLIPVTAAVMLSYALTPIVRWQQKRLRLPKAIGAAVILGAVLLALGYGVSALQPQALNVLDILPRGVHKLVLALRGDPRAEPGAVDKLKKAASEIEQAANAAANGSPTTIAVPVTKAPPADHAAINLRDYVFMGTASVIAAGGQFLMVICLVYFLLVTGDAFRRSLLRVCGDTMTKKKITLQILDEIDSQVQRYLLVQLATSALLGLLSWVIFAWVGLEDAAMWAVLGGLLHLVPYVGPTAFVAVTALVAFVQFDSVQPVITIIGSVLVGVGVIGLLLVPWLTQRVGRIKAVTVFVSLLVWGWLWGIWGLLLGVPIVMAINAVCERVEGLRPISDFLSVRPRTGVQP
jgi:predicted PurR-regulated permease PerM